FRRVLFRTWPHKTTRSRHASTERVAVSILVAGQRCEPHLALLIRTGTARRRSVPTSAGRWQLVPQRSLSPHILWVEPRSTAGQRARSLDRSEDEAKRPASRRTRSIGQHCQYSLYLRRVFRDIKIRQLPHLIG